MAEAAAFARFAHARRFRNRDERFAEFDPPRPWIVFATGLG